MFIFIFPFFSLLFLTPGRLGSEICFFFCFRPLSNSGNNVADLNSEGGDCLGFSFGKVFVQTYLLVKQLLLRLDAIRKN